MPEMRYDIEWPGGLRQSCYSPSLVIKDFFTPGQTYPLADFLQRSRTALTIASERVRAKYGMPCGRAMAQLTDLQVAGERYQALPDARITVLAFHE